jgi:His-Xaa-Ser system radical SAM maturase HxsC
MTAQKLNLRPRGVSGLTQRAVARITFEPVPPEVRTDYFFALCRDDSAPCLADLNGYAAVFVEQGAENALPEGVAAPVITGFASLSGYSQDSIAVVNAPTGETRIVYRPESQHNALFATGRCNSNCLMCSQPPKTTDDNRIVEEHLRIIDLIKSPPESLGITGGEPTLLGDGLVRILVKLKERFPGTHIQMLTNGRLYAYEDFVRDIASVSHPKFISAIPLYADVASIHDYVVQARGAFDQTITGLYNTAQFGLQTEVRVVLHKQTLPRLLPLMKYIHRNLPFVSHIVLMGLENMGYVKKNWGCLWVDPLDYMQTLQHAVRYLFYRGMDVSIYNLQLCLLPKALWPFARQSISDFKNIYLGKCGGCLAKQYCGGLFLSSETRHSRGIHPVRVAPGEVLSYFSDCHPG